MPDSHRLALNVAMCCLKSLQKYINWFDCRCVSWQVRKARVSEGGNRRRCKISTTDSGLLRPLVQCAIANLGRKTGNNWRIEYCLMHDFVVGKMSQTYDCQAATLARDHLGVLKQSGSRVRLVYYYVDHSSPAHSCSASCHHVLMLQINLNACFGWSAFITRIYHGRLHVSHQRHSNLRILLVRSIDSAI
eukprot:scaffold156954_cov18-Prasinocladus_malaysianus.AAC.1